MTRFKWTRLVALTTLCASMTGCFTHRYVSGKGANENQAPRYSRWHSHWFNGLISSDRAVNLSALCPSGNFTVVDKRSFLNLLVSAFVGLIWSPSEVKVYCDDTATPTTLNLSPETLERLARSEEAEAWVREELPDELERFIAAREQNASQLVCAAP